MEFISGFRRGIPDLHMTIEQMVAEDELVTCHFRATGTQTAELLGSVVIFKWGKLDFLSFTSTRS